MAMKHRKLFPTSVTNQTEGCLDICSPACPDGCYPYPYYYFMQPPPPPPPPPPSPAPSNGERLSLYAIIIVPVILSILLLAIIFIYRSRLNRFWPRTTQSNARDEEFLEENHGPEIDHPIWYITTVGLQPSVISSIMVIKYKKGDGLIEGTDCSVCLSEFQEDETLRLLPKCSHAFHIPCIDTWLRSHTNCPLCRAGIVSNTVSATPSASNEQNFGDLGLNGITQIENLEIGGGLDVNQVRDGEDFENRRRTGEEDGFPLDRENPKIVLISSEAETDHGSFGLDLEEKSQMVGLETGGELDKNHIRDGEASENRGRIGDEGEFPQVDETKDTVKSNEVLTSSEDSDNKNFPDLGPAEETQIEIPATMNRVGDSEGCKNRAATEHEVGLTKSNEETRGIESLKTNILANGNGGFWMLDDSIEKEMVMEDESRSETGSSRMFSVMGGSATAQSLHKGPILEKTK
ncbi:hypothetical protein RJ639_040871 [Escallonia herrerae]|uniref:RING-type E3 ubiquitin transferase n=1 Tax=Escallonia herrerae TaxID=1293975 RepID=A0AA88WQQ1_9ASTE|nr:hypothetical protein RJ639_040871 [Escallonia herrerae]